MEGREEATKICVELFPWIRTKISLLSKKGPLLGECGLGASGLDGLVTDLIATNE